MHPVDTPCGRDVATWWLICPRIGEFMCRCGARGTCESRMHRSCSLLIGQNEEEVTLKKGTLTLKKGTLSEYKGEHSQSSRAVREGVQRRFSSFSLGATTQKLEESVPI